MYRGYWPNAVAYYKYSGGKVVRLFSYTSCDSLKEAKDAIQFWQDTGDYILIASFIEHGWDKRKVCYKFYEDNIQHLEYGSEFRR